MKYCSDNLQVVRLNRFHSRLGLSSDVTTLLPFFIDTPRLAHAQGRFAGSDINPGHFFSLTEKACVFEMLFYNRVPPAQRDQPSSVAHVLEALAGSPKERVFLTCEASFDKILNLLWPATLRRAIANCFPLIDVRYVDYPSVLLSLANADCGGSWITDVFGQYAYDRGYNGVRFPSARAVHAERNRPWAGGSLLDGLRYGPIGDDDSYWLDDLMQEIHSEATNVVVFRGTCVLRHVTRFRVTIAGESTGKWQDNEWWLRPEAEIERAAVSIGGSTANTLRDICTRRVDTSDRAFDWWYV